MLITLECLTLMPFTQTEYLYEASKRSGEMKHGQTFRKKFILREIWSGIERKQREINKKKEIIEKELALVKRSKRYWSCARLGKTYSEIAEETGRSTSTILKWVKKGKYLPVQECVNRVGVKNLETGLVFESLALAAEWSGCTRRNFSSRLQKGSVAGHLPNSQKQATWVKI